MSISSSDDTFARSVQTNAQHGKVRHLDKASTRRGLPNDEDDEPLVDTTISLPLHSKKLDRQNKRQEKKSKQQALQKALTSLFRLPPELLLQVFAALEPSDVLRAQRVCHAMHDFIEEHRRIIGADIIHQRYRVLSRCFLLPVPLAKVNESAYPALLNPKRQKMLAIHKKPYQHIPVIDQTKLCTCMTCIFAWNNLNLLLDFAHWQANLNNREPIPMIPRGRMPDWNEKLMLSNATVVNKAIDSPLIYAAILQRHLSSINGTILRRSRWTKKPTDINSRVYHLSETEAASGNDAYLERSGPPSYEFPFHRDNYYSLEAYVPNRKWSKENQRWMYYAGNQHDRDVEWTVTHFSASP